MNLATANYGRKRQPQEATVMRKTTEVTFTAVRAIHPKPARACHFKDCRQPGEHVLIGDARLCLEHFLRDRVRLNLARLGA